MTIQESAGLAGGFIIYVRAYTDMSAATTPEMTTSFIIGNDSFFDQSDWNQKKKNWRHIFW